MYAIFHQKLNRPTDHMHGRNCEKWKKMYFFLNFKNEKREKNEKNKHNMNKINASAACMT